MPNTQSASTGKDSVAKLLLRNATPKRVANLLQRGWATLRGQGWQALWRGITFRFFLATHAEVWRYRADIPLWRELKAQRRHSFAQMPLVSVLVPLYNTPVGFLRQMLNSVRQQSYQKWELVLANASSTGHEEVARICQMLAKKDDRIKYLKLEENGGISANTNAAIAKSSGQWLLLLDHDDVLSKNALYEVVAACNKGADFVYSDEVVLSEDLKRLKEFHFKAAFAPDTLRGCNYITHICAFSSGLLAAAGGGENSLYDGAQDYELILRLSEKAKKIYHVPKVLYWWRGHANSTAAGIAQKPKAVAAGAAAIQGHLARLGLAAGVQAQAAQPGAYRLQYSITAPCLVSVLIPSSDHSDDLQRCLARLYAKSGWQEMEVLVIDNNSQLCETQLYYHKAQQQYPNLKVLHYQGRFNYAAINNYAAAQAQGAQLLLLNNDVEIISPGFVQELLSYSQRADVGAVGAMLYYPDDTVQHAGLILGIGGTAGVSHKGHARGDAGDMFRLCTTQNVSAVTGAALMVKKKLYMQVQGLDEENFAIAFNDVDFCLKLHSHGCHNLFTPFAQAYHHESKTRGYDTQGEKKLRFEKEAAAFREKWQQLLADGDPYYNPHFTLQHENFAYR